MYTIKYNYTSFSTISTLPRGTRICAYHPYFIVSGMALLCKYNKNFKGITIVKYFQAPFVKLSTIEEVINSLAYTYADSVISVEGILIIILK